MLILLSILYSFIGGILFRIRGGFLPTGSDTIARSIYSVGLSVILYLTTFNWMFALIAIPALFLGATAPNNFSKRNNSLLFGLESGLMEVAPIVLLSAIFGYYIPAIFFLFAAGLKSPIFVLSNYIPSTIPNFNQGGEMMEFLYGCLLGLSAASFLFFG